MVTGTGTDAASGTGRSAARSSSVAVSAMVVEERADAARWMESLEFFVARHTNPGYARNRLYTHKLVVLTTHFFKFYKFYKITETMSSTASAAL